MADYSTSVGSADNDVGISDIRSSGAARPLVVIASIASPLLQPQDWIIYKFYLQSLARELLPDERVAKCLRQIIPGKRSADIKLDRPKRAAHYANLITCGRIWQCPVCASKITEKRAQELQTAVARWHEQGGFVALLTFTLRHNIHDDLKTSEQKLKNAFRRFKSGAPFQRMQQRYGWVGSITATEVTHGDNGWHPHLHGLAFFEPLSSDSWAQFKRSAKARWLTVLDAEGAAATWTHGLDIREGDGAVADYVAKFGKLPTGITWTIERELTKAPVKRAHADGMTPFQMLEAYGDGDKRAGQLFQEYVRVFKGRAQLTWSRGLRELLGLGEEAADEALAELLPDELELLISFLPAQWHAILRLPRDIRAELLVIAGRGNLSDLQGFLRFWGISV